MARVYISSTYGDLRDCRALIEQDLRKLGHTDVAMENYGAEERSSLQRCLDDIAECDIYVGIFAWRYGWIPQRNNPEQRSITELEYRQAVAANKPCLIFLIEEAAAWPVLHVETDRIADIRRLRAELSEAHNPEFFRSVDDLRVAVTRAVARCLARDAEQDAPVRIYNVDEKIRLLDGVIQIKKRSADMQWPRMLTIASAPLSLAPLGLAGAMNFGWQLSFSLAALALVCCLALAVMAQWFRDKRALEAAEVSNRLHFYRSLYEQYGRDPRLVDAGMLREAETVVKGYLRQGGQG